MEKMMYRCKICKNTVLSIKPYCASCMSYEIEDSKCKICDEVFSNFKDYDEHLLTHPRCEFCSKMCKSESELKNILRKNILNVNIAKKYLRPNKKNKIISGKITIVKCAARLTKCLQTI